VRNSNEWKKNKKATKGVRRWHKRFTFCYSWNIISIFTKSLIQTAVYVGFGFLLVLSILIYQNNKRRQRLRESGISEIDAMDGIQFEYYLKELYSSNGYKVEITTASGDYGGDLILWKENRKMVIQAKRYSKDVGIKAVQEVMGAKAYYSADEAWVVTNSHFTKAATELAKKSNVILIDREQLIDLILTMNLNIQSQRAQEKIVSTPESSVLKCCRCGSPMLLRTGKKGQFYGCSRFPKCRYTQNVAMIGSAPQDLNPKS
jgi:restriction system protein